MSLNLPRIESICRIAAVIVWALGAFGKLFAWMLPADASVSGTMFSLLLGLALWGASIVLPDVFAVLKLVPPNAPKPPGT